MEALARSQVSVFRPAAPWALITATFSPVTLKRSSSKGPAASRITSKRMGAPFLEILGTATTEKPSPLPPAADGVGLFPPSRRPETCEAAPPGVQVGKGLQEGGAPPEAVTKLPLTYKA